MLCSPSPLSLLMWWSMFLLFFFRQWTLPLFFFPYTACVKFLKREMWNTKIIALTHLGQRRIWHQTAFKHFFYALPHLTSFTVAIWKKRKSRNNFAYDHIQFIAQVTILCSVLYFLAVRWICIVVWAFCSLWF